MVQESLSKVLEEGIGSHSFFCNESNISSVQLLSRVRLFATPWTTARQASLSITNSWNLLKLMSITSVMPSNHLILCWQYRERQKQIPPPNSPPQNNTRTKKEREEWLLVVVHVPAGKEFPGMRMNERRIRFLRVGDTVSGLAQRRPEPFCTQ